MSVTDSLVGRVIGLGGNKINSITVSVLKFSSSMSLCVFIMANITEGEWSPDHCVQQTTKAI